jgi:reactive chlorine resistance protein C
MRTRQSRSDELGAAAMAVIRSALATNLVWIGALKWQQYEVDNIDPLVTSSPLFARLKGKLGARRLARLIGLTDVTLGALIGAKRVAPRASAVGSTAAVGIFLTTLSFLVTTPEAWQGRRGMLSPAGQFLLKDGVLLGAALLTASESLAAARRRS